MPIFPIPPMPASNPHIPPANVFHQADLKAPSAIVMGDPGAGKTAALVTLLECGIEVFIIVTDPNGLDSILDAIRFDLKTRKPRAKDQVDKLLSLLHWTYAAPSPPGWNTLKEMAKLVQQLSYADVAALKNGIDKVHTGLIMSLVSNFEDFVCDRTGQHYGDVTEWTDLRALVIDSLSGINKMAKEQAAGFKPALHQGEWGIAMSMEEQLIFKLASDCKCYFIVNAHLDKITNEVTGIPQISVAALGNKLAPQLIKNFSEVIHAKRIGADFFWSTSEANMAVKNRALPISDKLPPSYAFIVAAHLDRLKSLREHQT